MFSRSSPPQTVIFPDDLPMENLPSYSPGSKVYAMTELLPESASVAFTWNTKVSFSSFSLIDVVLLKRKTVLTAATLS